MAQCQLIEPHMGPIWRESDERIRREKCLPMSVIIFALQADPWCFQPSDPTNFLLLETSLLIGCCNTTLNWSKLKTNCPFKLQWETTCLLSLVLAFLASLGPHKSRKLSLEGYLDKRQMGWFLVQHGTILGSIKAQNASFVTKVSVLVHQ